jgi:lipoprotein-anchoring transpeptidase ErfK/SrfK
MKRLFAVLLASAMIAGTMQVASAQDFFSGFFGGGSGSGPVPRQIVQFEGNYKPGSIIIDTEQRRLYLVLGNGQALRYGIGVGRDGFRWGGVHRVTAKKEWPAWTPPSQMLARRPDLPRHMEGGPENPLGARALYLGSTLYRIHGSNEPETIGTAVSSGCFRMVNDDVIDLYNRVSVGATVYVINRGS